MTPVASPAALEQLTLSELCAGFASGELSPTQVVDHYLQRIACLDPRLNAYVDVWHEEALAQARESEARWQAGRPLGMLDGAPLALKDLFHVQGQRCAAGSALYAGRAAHAESSTVARRLRAAGAVLLGRTHMVELAYGGWGTHQTLGTPRNPWDEKTHRVPGGSSSGSGVAVAAGLAAGALGTDTGGSVRIPAAFCGITGLKTTQGRISRHGMDLLSPTLDTIGPMVRSAEDAARMLQVLHGSDPADASTHRIAREDFVGALSEPVAGLRFTVLQQTLQDGTEPAVRQAVLDCVQHLRSLGCREGGADQVPLDLAADQASSGIIISAEGYRAHGAMLERCQVPGDAPARARVLLGARIDVARYRQALDEREQAMQAFHRVFADVDFLVLPTVQISAPALADVDEQSPVASRLTRFVGYYGLCAIALPAGTDAQGMPVSVQLVAAPFREGLLLRLGAALQRQSTHHRLSPRFQGQPH